MSSDVPPSYGSAEQLPRYEADVLAFNAQIPDLTAAQKVSLENSLDKMIMSSEAVEHLKDDATKASDACNAIAAMFISLKKELAKIDAKNMPPKEGAFVPRFKPLSHEYHRIVNESRDLAVKIAVYGQRFDTIIVPFCNDESLPLTERSDKVTKFINDADTFSNKSDVITNSFKKLEEDFEVFTSTFSGWAIDKEGTDTEELERARKDLEDLKRTISISRVFVTMGAWFILGSFLVPGILSCLSGNFASFIIAGALVAAGIADPTLLGLAIAYTFNKEQVSAKQARIVALVQSISDIKATRENLKLLGTKDLELLSKNISAITLLWKSARNDALQIKAWLEGGADDADRPQYMKKSLNEAVSIYKQMAVYFRQYADGISSVNAPKPSPL